jgi:bifunctional non-homologous end joining protein LigD
VAIDRQLSFPLGDPADGSRPALPARLGFPVPTEGGRPFDDDERFFEPWWPGALALLRREGDRVELRTEHLSDPLAIFPELRAMASLLAADGVIVEGILMALDAEGRPDPRLLRRHLAGSVSGPAVDAAFVATDLAYLEGRSVARLPFVERRRRLAALLPDVPVCALSRGLVGEGVTLARAAASLGLAAVSVRRLDGRWHPGQAGDDWLRLRVHEPVTLPTKPFLVLLEKLPLAG